MISISAGLQSPVYKLKSSACPCCCYNGMMLPLALSIVLLAGQAVALPVEKTEHKQKGGFTFTF